MSVSSLNVHNRLTASSLATLLDARKETKTVAELRQLCHDFNIDEKVLRQLTRYVTSPSLSLQRTHKNEKDDTYLVSLHMLVSKCERKAHA